MVAQMRQVVTLSESNAHYEEANERIKHESLTLQARLTELKKGFEDTVHEKNKLTEQNDIMIQGMEKQEILMRQRLNTQMQNANDQAAKAQKAIY